LPNLPQGPEKGILIFQGNLQTQGGQPDDGPVPFRRPPVHVNAFKVGLHKKIRLLVTGCWLLVTGC